MKAWNQLNNLLIVAVSSVFTCYDNAAPIVPNSFLAANIMQIVWHECKLQYDNFFDDAKARNICVLFYKMFAMVCGYSKFLYLCGDLFAGCGVKQ